MLLHEQAYAHTVSTSNAVPAAIEATRGCNSPIGPCGRVTAASPRETVSVGGSQALPPFGRTDLRRG